MNKYKGVLLLFYTFMSSFDTFVSVLIKLKAFYKLSNTRKRLNYGYINVLIKSFTSIFVDFIYVT